MPNQKTQRRHSALHNGSWSKCCMRIFRLGMIVNNLNFATVVTVWGCCGFVPPSRIARESVLEKKNRGHWHGSSNSAARPEKKELEQRPSPWSIPSHESSQVASGKWTACATGLPARVADGRREGRGNTPHSIPCFVAKLQTTTQLFANCIDPHRSRIVAPQLRSSGVRA